MVSKTPKKHRKNGKSANSLKNLKNPWEPGVCGNPKGRPKGARSRETIVREWLETKATDGGPGNKADQIARAQILKASKGDTNAFNAVMDSAYGKNPDVHEISGPSGQPFETVSLTPEQASLIYQRALKSKI